MLQALCAIIGVFIAIKILKPVAITADLVDKPNARKTHDGAISLVGGIALYLGLCGSLLVGELPFYHDLYLYILALGCMVAIGVADDKHDLSVRASIVGRL